MGIKIYEMKEHKIEFKLGNNLKLIFKRSSLNIKELLLFILIIGFILSSIVIGAYIIFDNFIGSVKI